MHSIARLASLLLPAVTMLLSGPSSARELCGATPVDVTVAMTTPHERRLVCAGARQALDLLASCGIAPRSTIDINIKSEVRHPLAGPIFGYFDLDERQITLTSLDGLPELMQDTPYAGLPPDTFYKSLAVHEVVHSVMHQNLEGRPASHAAYEYPAYALQIASLPAADRSTFLKAFDRARIERASHLSDTILTFAPYFFAARAYTHFATSPSGCAYVRAVMMDGHDKLVDARVASDDAD